MSDPLVHSISANVGISVISGVGGVNSHLVQVFNHLFGSEVLPRLQAVKRVPLKPVVIDRSPS